MKISRLTVLLALPLVLAAVAAGCGGSSNSSSSDTSEANATADTSESGGTDTSEANGTQTGESGQTPIAGAEKLSLSADPSGALKFNQSSLSAKAGAVTIQMSNPSSIQHGISIEGNGVDAEGNVVGNGGTATVSANLKPGTYTFYCPVDSHRQQGMQGTLTVK
jgi:plastocyanin